MQFLNHYTTTPGVKGFDKLKKTEKKCQVLFRDKQTSEVEIF